MGPRITRLILAGAVCLSLAAACSRRPHGESHAAERHAPEPAPPTPDTTPIEILRTPAGLVLGVEGTPAPPPAVTAGPGTPPPAHATTVTPAL